jgi:hypothetical protein
MSSPSNLYAEKIFSEHPLVLWALDDKLDYISLISEEQRNILGLWEKSNCTLSSGSALTGEPFPDSYNTKVSCDVPITATNEAVLISPDLVNFQDLDLSLKTFCVGTHFYSNSPYIESVSIGYEYTDTTTSQIIQKLKTFKTSLFQQWGFVSETFDIPDESTSIRIVIKVITTDGGSAPADYEFYFNGITLGQWSEEFNVSSLGVQSQSFPANISLQTTSKVVSAAAYGISSDTGYYLVNNKSLVAKNTGIPLVFGASGITKLTPNNGSPSVIFPGKGFLHETGRYNNYTVEFWARINSESTTSKKIFGPIGSTDGLYVDDGFLTLLIGENFTSHFISEWFRPMLIHIAVVNNNATVMINGEEVISLNFNTASINLSDGVNEDWLGFYSYEDVTPVEIDCFAIYSYRVPDVVAKRRWVYGQGVASSEAIDSAYGGTSAVIDYTFADYTANYNYPSFAQWQQGSFDNLTTTEKTLKTPDYVLPTIFTGTKTLEDLYDDSNMLFNNLTSGNMGTDNRFISLNPNSTWDNEGAYLYFTNFNVLNDQVACLYGVFEISNEGSGTNQEEKILFKVYSQSTGNYFMVKVDGLEVVYSLNYGGVEQEVYRVENIVLDEPFSAGFNIETLVASFGGNLSTFFGNQNSLSLYVGGDNDGDKTFNGYIYSVGFSTKSNLNSISDLFNSYGVLVNENDPTLNNLIDAGFYNAEADLIEAGFYNTEVWPSVYDGGTAKSNAVILLEHLASYTLLPTFSYDKLFLDIGVSGHWEDYLPLSYFGQYVQNDSGNSFYDLDFLQFNLGYPSPETLLESTTQGVLTYEDLMNSYKTPVRKTYAQLQDIILTGWYNYGNMLENSLKSYNYNTENASIRSYITFQYVDEGANALSSYFTNTVSPQESSVIDVSDYTSWQNTKFEIIDNTLVYPRKDIDFNKLAVVYSVDFKARGIIKKPIVLKKLEIASQALNDNSFNPIGTKFGSNLFPYTRSGLYYDYKTKNPFSIYKGSTPYLYTNNTSGIQIRGDFDLNQDRGISMPVNQSIAENYRVSALQSWIKYEQRVFPPNPIALFEVEHKNNTIIFYVVANDSVGKRGVVYAKNKKDNSDFNEIAYFINGKPVREPVLTVKEWSILGINFTTDLNFDLFLGSINLRGPATFNNISYYQANNLQQLQSKVNRSWNKVKQDGPIDYAWSYWLNNYTWDGVMSISSSPLYGVNSQDVYNNYMGTNKIIIDDESGMIFDADKMKIYNDTTWLVSVGSPV